MLVHLCQRVAADDEREGDDDVPDQILAESFSNGSVIHLIWRWAHSPSCVEAVHASLE